eukprot:CAMPEP_0172866092 /NCGR_PEP_ID=MMETSP1075-20121228/81787_1 /TAXON_ID=2916 /ORGANISM="Ceratium fusus, Strain PA161109" /LENGTH=138 /DNA_ID=CAMNT_0013715213 /DNA_START=68 /DNA_END=480 /DNA_ORIENTATION=-
MHDDYDNKPAKRRKKAEAAATSRCQYQDSHHPLEMLDLHKSVTSIPCRNPSVAPQVARSSNLVDPLRPLKEEEFHHAVAHLSRALLLQRNPSLVASAMEFPPQSGEFAGKRLHEYGVHQLPQVFAVSPAGLACPVEAS